MIGTVRGMMLSQKEVAGLPAAIASFRTNASGLLLPTLKTTVEAVQSGSGDPSPDNIRPISGWSGAVLSRVGKNLFDKTAISNNKWLSTTTGLEENASGYCVSDFIKVKGGQSVFIPTSGTARRWFYDSNKNPKSYLNNSGNQAFTPTEDGYIRVTIQIIGATPVSLDTYQIEIGSTATAYEPYNGNTYTLSFGSTLYGAMIDWETGVATVKNQILELSENWAWNKSSYYAGGYYTPDSGISPYAVPPVCCSHAKVASSLSEYVYGTCFHDSSFNFRIMSAESTLQDWKDFIVSQRNNGTPIQMVYVLKTPFTIQLTPQQITQLANDNNVFVDCGDVSVCRYSDRVVTVLFSKG